MAELQKSIFATDELLKPLRSLLETGNIVKYITWTVEVKHTSQVFYKGYDEYVLSQISFSSTKMSNYLGALPPNHLHSMLLSSVERPFIITFSNPLEQSLLLVSKLNPF